MLKELSIRNFAIIDDLGIRFSKGLTIMSGETGAGKSIVLNAVNLLLGSRASTEMVRTGAKAAELEALFEIGPESRAAAAMESHGYDAADGLLIRRLISRKDGSRVYVNGRLATIQALAAITEKLASISGQHAHQGLLKADQHLHILDQFGGLLPLREEVGALYAQLVPLIKSLDGLIRSRERQSEQIQLLRFQQKEIEAAAPQAGEDELLDVERRRLKHAEALYGAAYAAIETLYGGEGAVTERLAEIHSQLTKAAAVDAGLKRPAESLADIGFRIEDVVGELQSYLKTIQVDDRRLEAVEERLDALIKLKRKYGGSIDAVLNKLEAIRSELDAVENIAERIAAAESRLAAVKQKLAAAARSLSERRRKAAGELSERVETELATLKMAGTAFEAAMQPVPAGQNDDQRLTDGGCLLTETGVDRIEFMISPNVGEDPKPLAGIASGGELSRVVLALKSILAATDAVETVVFDEVDAGIGGGTAEVVGRKLAQLSRHHQVICITHLPQIAKFADDHLCITKEVARGRTRTRIHLLDDAARRQEIARMLGGERITDATLEHARELLKK